MSYLNLTGKQIQDGLIPKLGLREVQTNRETTGDYYIKEKFQFTITMPNVHGKQNISTGLLRACRRKMKLSSKQFYDLVTCPMNAEEYESLIQSLILGR